MRKIIIFTMIILLFICTSHALAEEMEGLSATISNGNNVIVSGKIIPEEKKQVTITVTDPEGNLHYVAQKESDADGCFVFSYVTDKLMEGIYDIKVGGENIATPYELQLHNTVEQDECFIATAAYGSGLSPAVSILRRFRDTYLLNSSAGHLFVNTYYNISPPIADCIARSNILKFFVKTALLPIIALTYILLNYELLLAMLFALAIFMHVKKHCDKRKHCL